MIYLHHNTIKGHAEHFQKTILNEVEIKEQKKQTPEQKQDRYKTKRNENTNKNKTKLTRKRN